MSVVIPVFNEEDVLPELARRLTEAADKWPVLWEAIFIDDGSSDGTFSFLCRLHDTDPRFKVLSFSRNFGHQVAVSAGLEQSRGDAVVIMDADLQDPPEIVNEFLKKWWEGYKVVYGVRRKRKEGLLKRSAYRIFYRILGTLADLTIPLDSGDFCLVDRRVVDELCRLPERTRFVRGLRAWVGFRQVGVEYERDARAAGSPKYSFPKLMRLGMDGIINFSFRPLSFISLIGLASAGFSFLGMVFFLIHRLVGFQLFGYSPQDVPGFTSIILSILFIGGVQLLAIGVVGEYVGRIFEEVKQRPLYVARVTHGIEPKEAPSSPRERD